MSHNEAIQHLLQEWAENTRNNHKATILANHTEDVVIYDALPPFKYEGREAYEKSWDEWEPETTGDMQFDLHDLVVVAGDSTAFAYGAIACGGTLADGSTFSDLVRATFCLVRKDEGWRIQHQHISMPVG